MLSDGANAEFGRSAGGFVNVITRSGTNSIHGSAHVYYTSEGLSAKAPQPDGTFEPKPEGDRYQTGFTFGGPLMQDKFFYFLSGGLPERQPDQAARPAAHSSPMWWPPSPPSEAPNENGSITRGDDAFVTLIKTDWHVNEANLATLRFNYTWADQHNGTFDVDSWGVSANAVEKVFSKALSGSLLSTLSASLSNEFRFQFAREDRPRPYDGPITPADRPAAPRHGVRLREGLPLRHAILHPGRLPRRPHAVRRERHLLQGRTHVQGGSRIQPDRLLADLSRLHQRAIHLQLDAGSWSTWQPELCRVRGAPQRTANVRAAPGLSSSTSSRPASATRPLRRRARSRSLRRSGASSCRTPGSRRRS